MVSLPSAAHRGTKRGDVWPGPPTEQFANVIAGLMVPLYSSFSCLPCQRDRGRYSSSAQAS